MCVCGGVELRFFFFLHNKLNVHTIHTDMGKFCVTSSRIVTNFDYNIIRNAKEDKMFFFITFNCHIFFSFVDKSALECVFCSCFRDRLGSDAYVQLCMCPQYTNKGFV